MASELVTINWSSLWSPVIDQISQILSSTGPAWSLCCADFRTLNRVGKLGSRWSAEATVIVPKVTRAVSTAEPSKALRISDLLPLQYFLDDAEIVLRTAVLRIDLQNPLEGIRSGLLALHLHVHQTEA